MKDEIYKGLPPGSDIAPLEGRLRSVGFETKGKSPAEVRELAAYLVRVLQTIREVDEEDEEN